MLALFWHDLMGVRYDGAARRLALKPLDALGSFAWRNAPMGNARFDIEYDGALSVKNRNTHAVTLEVQMFGRALSVSGQHIASEQVQYFEREARRALIQLLPGERVAISAH